MVSSVSLKFSPSFNLSNDPSCYDEGCESHLTQPVRHNDVRNLQDDHFDWGSYLLLTQSGLGHIGWESIQQKSWSLWMFPHSLRYQLHHLVLREIPR